MHDIKQLLDYYTFCIELRSLWLDQHILSSDDTHVLELDLCYQVVQTAVESASGN